MASLQPSTVIDADPEDLAFRHRSLTSARQILESELQSAHSTNGDGLYAQRLRRLKTYLTNAISAIEQQMEAAGLTFDGRSATQHCAAPRKAQHPRHLRVIETRPRSAVAERLTKTKEE